MNYETLKDAGYTYVKYLRETKEHVLRDSDGQLELWFANKNHANYGLIYKNTHLEFMSDYI